MRICTKAEEKDNLQAEMQFFNPMVRQLATDEQLVEINKMRLLQYEAMKKAEEDPIEWDDVEGVKGGQQWGRRSTRDDHEAGPSGH